MVIGTESDKQNKYEDQNSLAIDYRTP